MGSNPIPSIETSVQITAKSRKSDKYTKQYLSNRDSLHNSEHSLRDLYNRDKQLERWIHKVNTQLDEPDRTDVLKLVTHLQDAEKSKLWIIRYLTALLLIRKNLDKPFRNCSRNEIRTLLGWMKTKGYRRSTHEKFRVIIKSFYKIVYGENKYYVVNWFSVNVSKEIQDKDKHIDIAKYLEEEELKKLIESATSIQKKAFIAVCMNAEQDWRNF